MPSNANALCIALFGNASASKRYKFPIKMHISKKLTSFIIYTSKQSCIQSKQSDDVMNFVGRYLYHHVMLIYFMELWMWLSRFYICHSPQSFKDLNHMAMAICVRAKSSRDLFQAFAQPHTRAVGLTVWLSNDGNGYANNWRTDGWTDVKCTG